MRAAIEDLQRSICEFDEPLLRGVIQQRANKRVFGEGPQDKRGRVEEEGCDKELEGRMHLETGQGLGSFLRGSSPFRPPLPRYRRCRTKGRKEFWGEEVLEAETELSSVHVV